MKVVDIPIYNPRRADDEILEECKGQTEGVMVIGYDEDGALFYRGNLDRATTNYLIDLMKADLLREALD